jgi:hypothetical protein
MIIRSLIAAGFSTGLMVSAASAVTVVNTDKMKASLVYTPKGGKAHHYTLAANRHLKFACKSGGTLMLGKSSEPCTAKTGKITIKAGKLI